MITPVILSGGSGTRLWPLSRASRPKQMLALTGDRTMLQLTMARYDGAIVVGSEVHSKEIERQAAEIGAPLSALILEPSARNTAPAIALAALAAPAGRPMLVMPSDHLIGDLTAFRQAVEAAVPAAHSGYLVTFGILPDRPETGYGYISRGEEIGPGVNRVERFVEKPDGPAAQAMLADGRHLWNGGIFLFLPETYLAELERHAPDVLRAARDAIVGAERQGVHVFPAADAFAASPSISIDYAVMERAERVAVVPVSMGWSDIGSWDALHEIGDKDAAGLLASGEVIAIDSRNSLIRSDGPTIVTVGVEDLIVIASGDAVLIVPRGQSQRVKEAVEALKARGSATLT